MSARLGRDARAWLYREVCILLALAPRADPNSPFQVQVSYPDRGVPVREVYSLDPQRWVMLEGEVEEDGVRVEHVGFREIKARHRRGRWMVSTVGLLPPWDAERRSR